ncbi:hypothetical protein OAN87_00680 [bacterium]|nr:hypothetical protein [bacterium]
MAPASIGWKNNGHDEFPRLSWNHKNCVLMDVVDGSMTDAKYHINGSNIG